MTIYEKLGAIQQALQAPKSQFNEFGKYKYRSCEDVLAAVKPLLDEHKCVLLLKDGIETAEGRVYIKATAQFFDTCSEEPNKCIEVTAFAREEETKKGMDASQVTGAASSYARKYALNGLFCIDDNKDSDFTNRGTQAEEKPVERKQNRASDVLPNMCSDCGKDIPENVAKFSCDVYGLALCRDCQKSHNRRR